MEVEGTRIGATPLSPFLGAEISGLDLSREIPAAVAKQVRDLFYEHQVIAIRGQDIHPEGFIRFAEIFGAIEPFFISAYNHAEFPQIYVLSNVRKDGKPIGRDGAGTHWHSDSTFTEKPSSATLLHGVTVPDRGGDTLFADLYAAYETLSDGLRRLLDGLTAVHTGSRSYGSQSKFQGGKNQSVSMTIDANADGDRLIEHPVVRTHPETGRRCLFVNPNYTLRFKDMTEAESKPLLDFLYAHAIRDEFVCRFRWQAGSVAVWDNRCTMHRAVNDYDGARRHVRRVTLQGDRPV